MLRESAAHRWAQLARAGEPRAMRRVAELLLSSGSNGTQLQAVQLLALASEQGDAESLLRLGWLLYEGTPGKILITCPNLVPTLYMQFSYKLGFLYAL